MVVNLIHSVLGREIDHVYIVHMGVKRKYTVQGLFPAIVLGNRYNSSSYLNIYSTLSLPQKILKWLRSSFWNSYSKWKYLQLPVMWSCTHDCQCVTLIVCPEEIGQEVLAWQNHVVNNCS